MLPIPADRVPISTIFPDGPVIGTKLPPGSVLHFGNMEPGDSRERLADFGGRSDGPWSWDTVRRDLVDSPGSTTSGGTAATPLIEKREFRWPIFC